MNKQISPKIVSLVFSVLILCFVISFYVIAWTPPSKNPPGGNVDTPLNVGPDAQYKEGGLILNTGGASNGLIVEKGNVGIGTTSPEATLEVQDAAVGFVKPTLLVKNTASYGILGLKGIKKGRLSSGILFEDINDPTKGGFLGWGNEDAGVFSFFIGWEDILNVKLRGVGIGTSNPQAPLEIAVEEDPSIRLHDTVGNEQEWEIKESNGNLHFNYIAGSGGGKICFNGDCKSSLGAEFGKRASRSNGKSYTAQSDGFIVAMRCGKLFEMKVWVEGALRGHAKCTEKDSTDCHTITVPIRKGESYSISGASTATWIPLY